MIELPSSLRVGAFVYQVIEMSDEEATETVTEGTCDDNTMTISVHIGDRSPQRILETLLHELLHAVNYMAGIGDDTTEEDTVDRLTPMLMQVFYDNPSLWLLLEQYRSDELWASMD